MEHSDRFLEGKMGATIDEIIDSLKRGQGKRVSDLVKMALEEFQRQIKKEDRQKAWAREHYNNKGYNHKETER